MNNSFGHISEDLLQQAQEAWDFKTCQRSDGTTYGTSGDCVQRGSKEVKGGSKKSSWSPDDLAGKMGMERGKVASMVPYTHGTMPLRGAQSLCAQGKGEMLGIDCASLGKASSSPAPKPAAAPKPASRPAAAPKPSSKGNSKIEEIRARAKARLEQSKGGSTTTSNSKLEEIKAKARARMAAQGK